MDHNTGVEWGVTRVGKESGKQGKNFLTTMGDPKGDRGRSFFLRTNYTIRGHAHNHENDRPPSTNDHNNHIEMTNKYPKSRSYILYNGNYYGYKGIRVRRVPVNFE